MKINNPNIRPPAEAYKTVDAATKPARGKEAAEQTQAAAARADQVVVSDKAREAAALRAKVKSAPQVRTELVERIKAQVEAGTYKVDPRKVAEKMLRAGVFKE